MTYKNFEDYLQTKHSEQYHGLDDDMPDDYGDWLDGLSTDEWIEYADKYGKIKYEQGQNNGQHNYQSIKDL